MFFQQKSRWRPILKACNHSIASSALMHYLTEHTPSILLAEALEQYFENPGYPTALAVIQAEPELILLFHESRPGGIYHQLIASPQ